MSIKRISILVLAAAIGSIFVLNKIKSSHENQAVVEIANKKLAVDVLENEEVNNSFAQFTNLPSQPVPQQKNKYATAQGGTDFIEAAGVATPAVVHIKTKVMRKATSQRRNNYRNPFFDFFGGDDLRDMFQDPQGGGNGDSNQFFRSGSGSGVIISSDGYIVSNNHVVSAGDEIEVVLHDNKKYTAEVVGTDKTTDLALIKIQENNLPYLNFADSDGVRVGEWVLAVGNPFSLASTVTAGIVSAKARNINLLGQSAIESFIQTDAAVNPGNSGGALVNLNGDLIGINTAIASDNGVFAGYSFAVPSNLVAKVIRDLKEFGAAQRGLIGVRIRNVSDMENVEKEEYNINENEGIFVDETLTGLGAAEAGLQPGDVIVEVNDKVVSSAPQLQESVAMYNPGDKIELTYIRNNKRFNTNVTLKNDKRSTERIVPSRYNRALGADLSIISDGAKKQLNIPGGVQIANVKSGLLDGTDIKDGFIITKIQDTQIYDIDDIDEILRSQRGKGGVMIAGIYPENPDQTVFYAFGM